jgi:ATP-dependent helicase/nuclease subunit A
VSPRERADAAQRAAADPNASVFVTANAGSGKTKVLVDRIARLLLAPDSKPSAFLCITYTKAAAAEMQRRLYERLGEWCVLSDAALAEALMALIGPDAEKPSPQMLTRARALFARALETPGGLRIQTIHAFCERLLARFPLEAGVAPGFDIADEARAAALLSSARAALADVSDPVVALAAQRFAARLHAEAYEGLLDRLAQERAALRPWWRDAAALAVRHGAPGAAEEIRDAALDAAPWVDLADAENLLAASSPQDRKLAQRINEARRARENGRSAQIQFELYCRIALTKDGSPFANLVTAKLCEQSPWIAPLLARVAAACEATSERVRAAERAEDAAAAMSLARVLDTSYAEAKRFAGALDFEDLVAHAHALLSRAEAAPWVLYKLDGGVDHILVDEGQDTSPAQWSLIAPLQDEFFSGLGARGQNRTMFAVGDPKQSIYSFQGADPDKFLAEAQALSTRARRAEREFVAPMLETSFRSTPEVLEVVDRVFANAALSAGPPEELNLPRHLASREHEHGIVEVWPIAPRPLRGEAKPWDAPLDVEIEASAPAALAKAIAGQVRAWIDAGEAVWERGALRAMQAGDVIALVRKRGALFHELIRALKRAGLPVAGADRMVLKDELAVEDCLALMRVALDPADDLALACVLKGPWCDLDDDDMHLFPLAYGRGKGETLFARLMASTELFTAEARAFAQQLVARGGEDPFAFLSWALESVFADGRSGRERVLARLGAETRDPLDELVARALNASRTAAPSLQRFLYDIETDAGEVKRELEAAGGAVRVMTVHGAKGLEAPVVILPDTTGPVNDRPAEGFFITEEGPFLSASESRDDQVTAAAREAFKARARSEDLRLLYVAMTRARDRLIICGHEDGRYGATGEAPECWRARAEAAIADIGARCATPFGEGWRFGGAVRAERAQSGARTPIVMPDWARRPWAGAQAAQAATPSRAKALDPAVFSPRGSARERFRRGKLIHGLLERLPDVAAERRAEAARAWLTRQGASKAESESFAREAMAVIDHPGFAFAFGPMSRAEAPIVGVAAGRAVRGVVDRLALDGADALILDYKTDRPAPLDAKDAPSSYVLQMALYREVLRAVFPARQVRCALIWTEAPRITELSAGQMDAAFEAFARS